MEWQEELSLLTPENQERVKDAEGRVDLLEENEAAGIVFMATRYQFVTAEMGQVVDISIPAIKIVMDLYGVEDQLGCLNKVRKLFHHFIEKRGENAD